MSIFLPLCATVRRLYERRGVSIPRTSTGTVCSAPGEVLTVASVEVQLSPCWEAQFHFTVASFKELKVHTKQCSTLQGVLWICILFMDRTSRYIFGWVLAINAFAFLANTNIGWALGYIPPQYDVLFSPAGAAYIRSFEAIFGFWIAIRAFEPEEGFAKAEAARKRGLSKSS